MPVPVAEAGAVSEPEVVIRGEVRNSPPSPRLRSGPVHTDCGV